MEIKFSKTCKVKSPFKAYDTDAGIDFFIPEEFESLELYPGDDVNIKSGIKIKVPHGYALVFFNKSGICTNEQLIVGACVIDSGYDGEIFINLHNVGNETQWIDRNTKIAQLVLVPVVSFRAVETQSGDLYDWYPITISDRGEGALGSTGE